jgi:hypothetical protein
MKSVDMDPAIRFVDPVMIIAHWHNAAIIDLGARITLSHVRALRINHSLQVTRFPNLITGINTVRATVPMSDKAVHDEFAKMLKEQRQSGIEMKIATVHEGSGVAASAARAVVRTILTLTGNRHQQIVANVAEGVTAILPFVRTAEGETVTRTALDQAISKVRAVYEKQLAAESAQPHP